MSFLEVKDLHAAIDGKEILTGLDLKIDKDEVHVIMGPNGSGKSTFANVLLGHPKYTITSGDILVKGNSIIITIIDYTKEFGLSSSGKSKTVASTRGNVTVEGTNGVVIGLNAYRKA